MNTIDRDLPVIGAGPVALYAAHCAGLRRLSTVVALCPEEGTAGPELAGDAARGYKLKLAA